MRLSQNRVVVLISGMLIQLCAGIIYMWSVFRNPVAEHLNWDLSAATLTSSVMLAAFVIGIVGGGRAQDKIGPRKVVVIGSIMISVGMLLTAAVNSSAPWLIYVTYGIIGGLGVGFVYTTTVSVIQKWFPDKRGFATGMMVSSFGFSLVIFAPVTSSLLEKVGVPMTFVIIGLLFLVVCVICSLFISNPPEVTKAASTASAPAGKHYKTSEMLKTKQFYLIALSMFFVLPAYFILNPLFKTLGVERGLTEGMATLLVMITGIASASGRLVFSWISDIIGRKAAIIALIVVTLASVLLLIPAKGIFFLVCVGAIAFAFGGSAGVYPSLTADNFGTKYGGLNYGCVMVGFGISALLFPVISNAITKDGDYTATFILSAVCCIISLVLMLMIKPVNEKK
ncbi:MAG: OFA family MFS transporter [Eubacteriales bacterium]|nr:OFA family MFS transporter [Eubacteriales bacterium]MDD4475348.1 OFA family MFS transporter [Eubacteriales bacterium]